jgi:hypothetical protein
VIEMGKRSGIYAAVSIGALIVALFATGGALGGKSVKKRSATTAIEANESGSATARCGRRTKAVSGGFQAEITLPATPTASESRRTARRKWTSEAFNFAGGPGELTSFAYCRREKRIREGSQVVPVAAGASGSALARCPRDTVLISGGFAGETAGPDPLFLVETSRARGKRFWQVKAENSEGFTSAPGNLAAHVYCRNTGKLRERAKTKTVGGGPAFEAVAVKAKCKRSQRVISGGFEGPDPDEGAVMASKKRGKRRWLVRAVVFPPADAVELTAYAYCEKKRR